MALPSYISNIKQFIFPKIQCADGSTIQLRINKGANLGYDILTGSMSASLSGSQVCYLNAMHEVMEVGTYQLIKHDADGDLAVPQIPIKLNDSYILDATLGNVSGTVTSGTVVYYNLDQDNTSFLDTVFSDTSTTSTYECYWTKYSQAVAQEVWFFGNIDVTNIPKEVKLVNDPGTAAARYQEEWQITCISWVNNLKTTLKVSDMIKRVTGWDETTRTFSPISTDTNGTIPVIAGMSNWQVPPKNTYLGVSTDTTVNLYQIRPKFSDSTGMYQGVWDNNIVKYSGTLNNIETFISRPNIFPNTPPLVLPYWWPHTESYPNGVNKMSIVDLVKECIATIPGAKSVNVNIDNNKMFDVYAQSYSSGVTSGYALTKLDTPWDNLYVVQNFTFGFSIPNDHSLTASTTSSNSSMINYQTSWPCSLPYDDPLVTPLKWFANQTGTFIIPSLTSISGSIQPYVKFIGRRTKVAEIPNNWILGTSNEEPVTVDATAIIVQNVGDDMQIQAGIDSSNVKTIQIPWRVHKQGPRFINVVNNAGNLNDAPDNLWYYFDNNLKNFQPLAVTCDKKIAPPGDVLTDDNINHGWPAEAYWRSQTASGIGDAISFAASGSDDYFLATDKGWIGGSQLYWKSGASGCLTASPQTIYFGNTGKSLDTAGGALLNLTGSLTAQTTGMYYSVAAILPAGVTLPNDEHLTPPNGGLGYFCPLAAYAQFYFQEYVGPKITLTQTYQGCVDDNGYMATIVPGLHKQDYIHGALRDFNAHEIEIDPVNCTTKVKWIEQFYTASGTPNGNQYVLPPLKQVGGGGSSSNSGGGAANNAGAIVTPAQNGVWISKQPQSTGDNALRPYNAGVTGISFSLYPGDNSDFITFADSSTSTTVKTRFKANGTIGTTGSLGAGTLNPNTTLESYGDFSISKKTTITLADGNNNDVSVSGYSYVDFITSGTAPILTGLTSQSLTGKFLYAYFNTIQYVTISNNSGSSAAGNRILTTDGLDIYRKGPFFAEFIWDASVNTWIITNVSDSRRSSPYFVDDSGYPTRYSIVTGGTAISKDAIAIGAGATATANSAIAIGWNASASGNYTLSVNTQTQGSGSYADSAITMGYGATISGSSSGSVVIGGSVNSITGSKNSVILGGTANAVSLSSDNSFIGGGTNNKISSPSEGGQRNAIIVGNLNNISESPNFSAAYDSTIVGGTSNTVSGAYRSSIIGGTTNKIVSSAVGDSTIIGGKNNSVTASVDTSIIGGNTNKLYDSTDSAILAGNSTLLSNSDDSIIAGGTFNTISLTSKNAAIIAGGTNTIANGSIDSFIGGGTDHVVSASTRSAIIGGGGNSITSSTYSTINGGQSNYIKTANNSIINGGNTNIVGEQQFVTPSNNSIINGGNTNTINSDNSVIDGGHGNKIIRYDNSFIAAGENNNLSNLGTSGPSFVVGGQSNTIFTDTTRGGANNANGIVGGISNTISGEDQSYAFIVGGDSNLIKLLAPIGTEKSAAIISSSGTIISCDITSATQNATIISSITSSIVGGSEASVIASKNSQITTDGLVPPHNVTIIGSLSSTNNNSTQSNIIGGQNNSISYGTNVAIIGGQDNSSYSSVASFISASNSSNLTGNNSSIISATASTITSSRSVIIGGYNHSVSSDNSAIIAGHDNSISSNVKSSFIAGGQLNAITGSDYSVINGGLNNMITTTGIANAIIGGNTNTIKGNSHLSVAVGSQNVLTSTSAAFIGGYSNSGSAFATTIFGNGNSAQGFVQTVVGYFNIPSGANKRLTGDQLFIIGNGTAASALSNAFTVNNLGGVTATSYTGNISYFVSKNIDSTAVGTTPNNVGSYYADNSVIAWADCTVAPGVITLNSSFNVGTGTYVGAGNYTFTLLGTAPSNIITQVTLKPGIVGGGPGFCAANGLSINTWNVAGAPTDYNFYVTWFGRK